MRVASQILRKIKGFLRRIRERTARIYRGITANKVSISLASLFGAVTLLQLTLAAYDIQIGPRWGLILLALTLVFLLGAVVALVWPTSRSSTEPETPEQRRRKNSFEEWRKRIEGYANDKDNPLKAPTYDSSEAPFYDKRPKIIRRLTLEELTRQESEGKREILMTLRDLDLVQRFPCPVVSLKQANFNGIDLKGVNLQGVHLSRTHLKDADLSEAKLGLRPEDASAAHWLVGVAKWLAGDYMNFSESCDLQNADLTGAVLKDAVLVGCVLTGADFKGTDLWEADLRSADLRAARNLTQKQINAAYGSFQHEETRDTQLPDGLAAPESWRKPIHEQKLNEQKLIRGST